VEPFYLSSVILSAWIWSDGVLARPSCRDEGAVCGGGSTTASVALD
jgi:hypothetical protein